MISHEAPALFTPAALKNGATFNGLTNETITTLFNHVTSFNNNVGIPATEACLTVVGIRHLRAALVLAAAYTSTSVVIHILLECSRPANQQTSSHS
jgi:hypothetical protein